MSNLAQDIQTLLHKHRFFLASQNKHYKYVDPENRIFVMPKTPSDWRAMKNAIADLRRIIANPPPSSVLLEEERQARAREADVTLFAERKKQTGMHGAPKTNGTGYIYIDTNDSVNFVPDEIKEASREKAKQDAEWRGLIKRLRAGVKTYEQLEAECVHAALQIVAMRLSRTNAVKLIRGRSRTEAKSFIAQVPEYCQLFMADIRTNKTFSCARELAAKIAGDLLSVALNGFGDKYKKWMDGGLLPNPGPHTFHIGNWEAEGEIGGGGSIFFTFPDIVRAAQKVAFRNGFEKVVVEVIAETRMRNLYERWLRDQYGEDWESHWKEEKNETEFQMSIAGRTLARVQGKSI